MIKKITMFCAVCALMAGVVSCKADKEVDTASARIDNPDFLWPDAPQTTVISTFTSCWDSTAFTYPEGKAEVRVVRIVVPPDSRLGKHRHPMPNFGYVERGSVTVVKVCDDGSDGESRSFSQGEVVNELVGQTHYGISGPEGVVFLLFYAGAEGQELSVKQ